MSRVNSIVSNFTCPAFHISRILVYLFYQTDIKYQSSLTFSLFLNLLLRLFSSPIIRTTTRLLTFHIMNTLCVSSYGRHLCRIWGYKEECHLLYAQLSPRTYRFEKWYKPERIIRTFRVGEKSFYWK